MANCFVTILSLEEQNNAAGTWNKAKQDKHIQEDFRSNSRLKTTSKVAEDISEN